MPAKELSLTTQVDLTSFGVTERQFAGWLVLDECDTPVALRISFHNINPDIINGFLKFNESTTVNGQSIDGILDDGRHYHTRIEFISGVQPSFTENAGLSLAVTFVIQDTHFMAASGVPPVVKWLFAIVNVKLRLCDEVTFGQVPAGSNLPDSLRPWTRDTIVFQLAGRRWVLKDKTIGADKKPAKDDQHLPLITGSLETEAVNSDSHESVGDTANDICRLLSLALSRRISWISAVALDDSNNTLDEWSPVVPLSPYKQNSPPAVDNVEPGCLRGFIEKAWPILRNDAEWFRLTLAFLLEARIGPFIDARSVFLNILADRIAGRFRGSVAGFEIDPDLKVSMECPEFQMELARTFEKITPNWTTARTMSLIQQVNQWNVGPSFPESIRRACRALRLQEPSGKFLATRHKLLHECVLDPHDGGVVQYWLELDWLVLAMVLRMFDYEGLVYHHRFGANCVRLADQLTPANVDKNNSPC